MKTCPKCKKSDCQFYNASKTKTTYCKKCQQEYQRSRYRLNRQRHIDDSKARNKVAVAEVRNLRNIAKNKPCMDCGVQYSSWVMQFDHRPGEKKEANVSGIQMSKRKLILEIAKCDVVCANCHAERTHRRRTSSHE